MSATYYKSLTPQTGKVGGGSQSNFPAPYFQTDIMFATEANGGRGKSTSGFDTRWSSTASLTYDLNFELVPGTFNQVTGFGEWWINVPTLADGSPIYPSNGDSSLTTDGSSTSTFDSNYRAFLPLPNGSSLNVNDYSQGGNNGTNSNATAVSAQIDGGASFNGTNANIVLANESNFDEVNHLTIEGWVYVATGSSGVWVSKSNSGSVAGGGWGFDYAGFTAGQLEFFVTDGGGGTYLFGGASLSLNAWHRVVAKWDTGNSGNARMIMEFDGVAKTLTYTSNGTPSGIAANNTAVTLGAYGNASGAFDGKIDSFRFSDVIRSSNWGLTSYNAESNNSAFWALGTEVATSVIQFDAASNSGDQAASANYTFNRTVSGSNRHLLVAVELLTVTGATVVSVTDDDGGGNIPLTFIGAQSTVTGAGRVELWGLVAPATGTKAIRVILSASIESIATATSRTGVHQTAPTEAFNSAQATNAGSATNASVAITSITDQCVIAAACVANDTSIAAGQTSRNNVSGTLGSGADEDSNAPVTPVGATTMTFTGMGITATWAIAGVALRPYTANDVGVGSSSGSSTALGVGKSNAAAAGSSASTSTCSGVGKSLVAAVGSASETAAASGIGISTSAAVGAASAIGSASGVSSSMAAAVGSCSSTSSATAISLSTVSAVGSSSSTSTCSGVGASLYEASGAAAAVASAIGLGAAASAAVGSSSSTSTNPAISSALGAGVGSASSTSTASGVSPGGFVGTASSTSTATGVGTSLVAAVGSVASVSIAPAIGSSLSAAQGTASETATAPGISNVLAVATGSASSTSTASGIAPSGNIGIAASTSTALGVGSSIVAAQGVAAESSTALGIGAALAIGVGAAASTSTAVGLAPSGNVGTASSTSTATAVGASLVAATGAASSTSAAAGVGHTSGGVDISRSIRRSTYYRRTRRRTSPL